MSEKVILRKLGLSEWFPRDVLYSRKTALGVGIMKPSTIIDILVLKLYVGHKWLNNRIAKIIRINEEEVSYQNGFNENVIKTPRNLKLKEGIWSDHIGKKLEKRMIKIVNNENEIKIITQNKTIMDWVKEYVKNEKIPSDKIAKINYIWIYKKIYLPCELVGSDGLKETNCKKYPFEKSCIRWKINFIKVRKLSKKTIEEWQQYVEWLSCQRIQTTFDFEDYATFQYI